ncbi:MAG: GNAT family N-acetyltransferase [Lachnospiraceae bacterium]|nr:GNAT family N-acetyltransferase [Lachnospiraceae bacterium]
MFTFRELQPNDNAKIAAIVRKNLENAGLDIPGTAYFDAALDHLSEVYGRNDSRYFVLENETGQVVGGIGFACFEALSDTAELQKLYLDDCAKGSGLGYKMIAFIEDRMREAGFKKSYLETHDNLASAIHIYQKSGYKEIPRPDFVGHSSMNRFFIKEI